jgi:dipeptidyl-peptidase-4
MVDRLTIERIFAAPDLNGVAPRGVKLSPDGQRVTFLRGKAEDKDRYDLWEYHVGTGQTRLLVDSDRLSPRRTELSVEEEARRERQRIVGLSGIVEYEWSEDGRKLLFPLEGDAFVVDLDRPAEDAIKRVLETPEYETDIRFSPQGRFVSFIREQNLVFIELATGEETKVTTGGGGVLKLGMAEFVAQEEMKRYTGYWWSKDERYLAYTRVDEAPVDELPRFEIHADDVKVVLQRYPKAGRPNAEVRLFVFDRMTGQHRELPFADAPDTYLFRATFFPDSRHLAVQRQSRDQKVLELLKIDVTDGSHKVLIREESPTWVEGQDDLTFLRDRREMIWSSARDGYQHLYLHDWDGALLRRLTAGEWVVAGDRRGRAVQAIDERRRLVYFMGTKDSPVERHLYVQSLDADDPSAILRITQGAGVHGVEIAADATVFVDSFSAQDIPPQVGLYRIDGSRIAWIEENALDGAHPYAPFRTAHRPSEFGVLPAEDGQALHYRLMLPEGFSPDKRYPVLVYVYGGPMGQQVLNDWPAPVEHWLQIMAQRGCVVFTLDNRGTGYRGRAFDDPIYRRLGRAEVADQLAGVAWLKQKPWVDPARIGVFGWSYGGYMTQMLLFHAPGTFAAGVSGAPVTDWALYDTHYTERYMGTPQDNAEGYRESNTLSWCDRLKDPLLVVHGMADDNVLFTHSTALFAKLQAQNRPFEMMTYPGAKHSLVRVPGTGQHCLHAVTRFLERYLRPEG